MRSGGAHVVSDAERTAREYDAMVDEYAADNSSNAYNALYERPATVSLLGEVDGSRVLDVGCGSGELSEWLVDHGGAVTAFDVSPDMVRICRERLGDRARVLVADISEPLSFAATGEFDLVVASLVLHYVRDWEAALLELRRVLTSNGALVFSTHHPAMDWLLHSPDDYFAVKQVTETWCKGGGEFEVTFWRRPLTDMCEAVRKAGFVIERLLEPEPLASLAVSDEVSYAELRTKPGFLFFRCVPSEKRLAETD